MTFVAITTPPPTKHRTRGLMSSWKGRFLVIKKRCGMRVEGSTMKIQLSEWKRNLPRQWLLCLMDET